MLNACSGLRTDPTNNKKIASIPTVLLLFISILFFGCGYNNDGSAVLRVAVLPDQSLDLLHRQHDLLVDYLGKSLGLRTELTIPADYNALTTLFHSGQIDLAYFGGLTFVQARAKSGALPLVSRDIDLRFTSHFLSKASQPGRSIADYRGKKFIFGSRLSTSGHLMPRYFLNEQRLNPETLFSDVQYSGSHDKTIHTVLEGNADLCVVNSKVYETMLANGDINQRDVRIVWTTPPYAAYVWATRANLSDALRIKLRNAMLNLTPADPAHRDILESEHAGMFLAVKNSDFERLEKIAAELKLLD